jgi:hypothetical protein
MAKATKTRLLSFDMKDRPGLLSEVTEALAGAKVNITALCAYSWEDTAYFDMTTDSNAKAKKALAALKIKVGEGDAVTVEIANKVGELRKVAELLAGGGINIIYMYGTASSGRTSTAVISTSDNRKALRLINK